MFGLLLYQEHSGTHLKSKGGTIDKELELGNFEYAGSTLA